MARTVSFYDGKSMMLCTPRHLLTVSSRISMKFRISMACSLVNEYYRLYRYCNSFWDVVGGENAICA